MFSDGLRVFRRIARLPFSRQADAQGTARGGHVGTAHGVEVIAVGQVAAGEFRAEMFVEFVAHIGINHGNGLPVGVAVAALSALAEQGKVSKETVQQAIEKYGIKADSAPSWKR